MRGCDDHPKAALLEAEPAVPKGFLAVYVGEGMRRFVIPTTYLCMPAFRELMESAAEMFGYEHEGGLRIPCEEEDFKVTLHALEREKKENEKKKQEKKESRRKKHKEEKKKN